MREERYELMDGTLSTDYKIGDKFTVASNDHYLFDQLETVYLSKDDETDSPFFSVEGSTEKIACYWYFLVPYKEEEENNTSYETGEHYKGNGRDLISHWQDTNPLVVARAKQISQIERYCSRYGEKDNPLVEAKKILDYATRLVDWEQKLQEGKK